MLYEIFNLEVKSSGKKGLKIAYHIEKSFSEKLKIVTEINQLLCNPCVETYQNHAGKMTNDCLDINTEFLVRLAQLPNRPAYTEYNNLFTPRPGTEKTLFGSHHMVQLQYGNYFIGIDAAVEQFRQDGVVAEITIATSFDQLNKLLMMRHGLLEPWLINEIKRSDALLNLLKKEKVSNDKKDENNPPSISCTIL